MTSAPLPLASLSRCTVFPAEALSVETGALMGDPIGDLTEVVAGDCYTLDPSASPRELILTGAPGTPSVAAGSSVGTAGQPVTALARHQLMGSRGAGVEVLVLELDGSRVAAPLGPLSPSDDYVLLASEPVAGELASVASVSFARGTRITLAGGRQAPVESLAPGDRVLTRDHGPQPIRWTGQQTLRAEGSNAPVVIAAGALNAADDLMLSPDHRLFIYQRRDAIGTGQAEVLIRARHLVDGETIWRAPGGHVDYVHLLFDAHEIIYAEGIPTESLLVAPDVLAGLDEDLTADIMRCMGNRTHVPHHGVEASAADLQGIDAATLLRRAAHR
ncbi:hypothetical protein JANAI62_08630 [Jannaschia pagri]|uniref:Hedgehog/Intein (Hint) domain-containing protein n=1 Tax=Jannaschia pagri TaxID=2829797 RepID=A0ABQ4NIK2_9RHOB|nr:MULTISPECIES: Hint domain-containing protein [unclassified Jannaschia]GIT89652.1 hypothetical protein JANAI61_01100 [Jannaschia sp. AI_61]GIT94240.1 hypothetical protein JANAI62_08630 [Jannaschia sp. AI_62]